MPLAHRRVTLWHLLIAILLMLHLAGWIVVLAWVSFSPGAPGEPPHYIWDGSVVVDSMRPLIRSRGGSSYFVRRTYVPALPVRTVLAPPSFLGALHVWWPVAVSGGACLLVLAATRVPALRRLMERQVSPPRITIFRGMVVVGLVAFSFWLSGMSAYWIVRGLLVLLLTFVAGYRRGRLKLKIKAEPAAANGWVRLGIGGYSIAVLLAAVWLACALVWESFTPGHQ
jgi:hypothetical protein